MKSFKSNRQSVQMAILNSQSSSNSRFPSSVENLITLQCENAERIYLTPCTSEYMLYNKINSNNIKKSVYYYWRSTTRKPATVLLLLLLLLKLSSSVVVFIVCTDLRIFERVKWKSSIQLYTCVCVSIKIVKIKGLTVTD